MQWDKDTLTSLINVLGRREQQLATKLNKAKCVPYKATEYRCRLSEISALRSILVMEVGKL